jgi:hypothetical protein
MEQLRNSRVLFWQPECFILLNFLLLVKGALNIEIKPGRPDGRIILALSEDL